MVAPYIALVRMVNVDTKFPRAVRGRLVSHSLITHQELIVAICTLAGTAVAGRYGASVVTRAEDVEPFVKLGIVSQK
jgi:hypothetical protein